MKNEKRHIKGNFLVTHNLKTGKETKISLDVLAREMKAMEDERRRRNKN